MVRVHDRVSALRSIWHRDLKSSGTPLESGAGTQFEPPSGRTLALPIRIIGILCTAFGTRLAGEAPSNWLPALFIPGICCGIAKSRAGSVPGANLTAPARRTIRARRVNCQDGITDCVVTAQRTLNVGPTATTPSRGIVGSRHTWWKCYNSFWCSDFLLRVSFERLSGS